MPQWVPVQSTDQGLWSLEANHQTLGIQIHVIQSTSRRGSLLITSLTLTCWFVKGLECIILLHPPIALGGASGVTTDTAQGRMVTSHSAPVLTVRAGASLAPCATLPPLPIPIDPNWGFLSCSWRERPIFLSLCRLAPQPPGAPEGPWPTQHILGCWRAQSPLCSSAVMPHGPWVEGWVSAPSTHLGLDFIF